MTKKLKEMMDLAMRRISSKTSVLALLMMVFVIPALAQDLVKGTVIDNNGDAVIGATVVQKDDKKNATITDLDGNFTLRLPDGQGTILVSYVVMKLFLSRKKFIKFFIFKAFTGFYDAIDLPFIAGFVHQNQLVIQ